MGYQGCANYEEKNRSIELVNLGVTGNFKNHITAKQIRQNLGDKIFRKSTKISIHRSPIDFIVSLYWFQKTRDFKKYKELSLREWMEINYHAVEDNYKIAPISGPNSPDITLNYKTLVDDIKKLEHSQAIF